MRRTREPDCDAVGKQLLVVGVTCIGVLTAPGCKVPGLRCALPGPSTPPIYQINNGLPFVNVDGDSPSQKAPTPARSITSDGPKAVEQGTESTELNLTFFEAGQNSDDDSPVRTVAHSVDVAESVADVEEVDGLSRKLSRLTRLFRKPEHANPDEDIQGDGGETARKQEGESFLISLPLPAADDDGAEKPASAYQTKHSESYEELTVSGSAAETDLEFEITESSAYLPQAAFYSDPFLLGLINDALTGNQELRILAEEIRIANNEAYARSGEYRPFVTLGGGAGFDKSGRHTRAGAVEDQLNVTDGGRFPDPLGNFMVAANVSWELDIWNKLRNSQRAAAMRFLGTQEGRNYIITRVVAEVAESYYQLLALDSQLATLERTIEIQEDSLKVAIAKKEAGRGTELAVQRFRAEVEKNKSQRSIIRQKVVESENRINYLAGRYPQPVERVAVEFTALNMMTLGQGIPSELLRNRADIRQAEREVAAAGLDVSVARARFYPSLNLSAGVGWEAFATGYLFRTPESLIYGMALELVGPMINKRAIKADYASANAAQLQSIYNYQQTVLKAHIEVVNHLTKVENFRRSIEVRQEQLSALEKSVDAANKLFQNARAEYVEVLLAQRELQEARMELIETKQEQLVAIVNAYQALGGGGF